MARIRLAWIPSGAALTTLADSALSPSSLHHSGLATFAAALDGGTLPTLEQLYLHNIPASDVAKDALMARFPADSDDNSDEVE